MREINPATASAEPETVTTTVVPEGFTVTITPPETKAGRVISQKNETKLRDAIAAIQDVLASLEAVTEGKANEEEPEANSEEPPTAWLHDAIASYAG